MACSLIRYLQAFLPGMGSPWKEIRRNANWALLTRNLIIHILGRVNCEVGYYGMVVVVRVEEMGYDTIRNKLVAC